MTLPTLRAIGAKKEVTEQLLISDIKSCMKYLCEVTYQINFLLL